MNFTKTKLKKWTDAEDRLITELKKIDTPLAEIAELLTGRSVDAVRQRLFTLRHRKSQSGFSKRAEWFEGMRFGFFDLETSSLKASFGIILSWACYIPDATDMKPKGYKAAKPKDGMSGVVYYDVITKKELLDFEKRDKRITKSLISLINERVDLLIGFYSTRFDVPFLRSRAMYHKLDFPKVGSKYHLDMFYRVRSLGKLHRNSLEAHTQFLKIDGKSHVLGEIWQKAQLGDKESLGYIIDHNVEDVVILERLYERYKPFFRLTKKSI